MPAGIDPISEVASGVQTLGGIVQSFIGAHKQNKAIKALEKLRTPTYTPNKSVNDYYQLALGRYNKDPYQSAEYDYAKKAADRNLATGISALGDRRSSLAGVAALVDGNNNAMNRAGIAATNQGNVAFGQLGGATNAKAADDMTAFRQNVLAPYEKTSQLLNTKAAAGGQMLNAGLSNIFGGISNGAMIAGAQSGGTGGNGAFANTNFVPMGYATRRVNAGLSPYDMANTYGE